MDLYVDLETRSAVNLKTVGVYVYAPACRIMLNSWAVDDGPVQVDETCTPKFWDAYVAADRIIAHNAEFDRTVLQAVWPKIDIRFDHWYCTMAQARRHGLPGGLDKLCDVLKVPADRAKMKDSRALLMMFCKPNKDGTWNTKATHLAEWKRFMSYGGLDVEAMREVHRRCPTWNDDYERPIWLADQRINARGFAVDVQFATAAVACLKGAAEETDRAVADATGGEVDSARRVDALLGHILFDHGVDLPDLKAETIERRLKDDNLPDPVRELLALRQQSARTSTSKYSTLLRCVSADHRLRGGFTYSGAMRTQRWAGNRFQPHNMPRPVVGKLRGKALKDEIRLSIGAVKAGVYDLVGTYPLPEVLASAVRGCVVASKGTMLTVGDYANVEGRGLAWLAGEQWKLDAFRSYDEGTGPDLYKVAFAEAFGIPVDEVDDGQERQIGKVLELMLGYRGGVGAFVTGAATYKVDLATLPRTAWPRVPADVQLEAQKMWHWAVRENKTLGLDAAVFMTCDALKRLWRRRHPKIVRFWSAIEEAFAAACEGRTTQVGKLRVDKVKAWVRIRLPSGRFLSYPGAARMAERLTDHELASSGHLSYLGQNPYTKQWSRIGTYGGKLAENVTQGLCRDLLAESLVRCEDDNVDAVLHAHDEVVTEGEEDLVTIMTSAKWTGGLPLAVSTFRTDRYHKD
jgi:DNA polymerase